MDYEEFSAWLSQEAVRGRFTPEAVDDLLRQRRQFDELRDRFEEDPPGRVVAVVSGEIIRDDDVTALLDRCGQLFGDRPVYFEPILSAESRTAGGLNF